MSRLREPLARFEQQLRRLTPFAAAHKARGLPREEIARRLRANGLGAPDDVLDWFAWHNGSDSTADPGRSSVPIGPVYWIAGFDTMIKNYVWRRDFVALNTPDQLEDEIGWFPIIGTSHGDFVVADCRGPQDRPVQCTTLAPDESMRGRSLHTLSLAEMLEMWTTAMVDGTWEADGGDQWPNWWSNSDYDLVPLELKLTGLAP